MIQQLSIFAENHRGAMKRITQVLADNGINMNTLVTNDSAEYGIIRMIVYEPEKARSAFAEAGYLCRLDKVIAVIMSDEYGSLNRLLGDMQSSNIDINYIYISYDRDTAAPIAIIHAEGADEVEECLRSRGYQCLTQIVD